MLLASRKSLDTAKYAISPDALRNDPLSQKIVVRASSRTDASERHIPRGFLMPLGVRKSYEVLRSDKLIVVSAMHGPAGEFAIGGLACDLSDVPVPDYAAVLSLPSSTSAGGWSQP